MDQSLWPICSLFVGHSSLPGSLLQPLTLGPLEILLKMPFEATQAVFGSLSSQKESKLSKTLFISRAVRWLLYLRPINSFEVRACPESKISKEFPCPLVLYLSLSLLAAFFAFLSFRWEKVLQKARGS